MATAKPEQLFECLQDERTTNSLAYAAAVIFFYNYFLTFGAELRYMWPWNRLTAGKTLFVIARYAGFVSAILCLLTQTVMVGNVLTCFRFITIVASDVILALRTWAIWERHRTVAVLLICSSIGALVPCILALKLDIPTSELAPPAVLPQATFPLPQCQVVISDAKNFWIVPYIAAMSYEGFSLALTLVAVIGWRRRVPASVRSSLIDILWLDAVKYFVFMLGLSTVNIFLVLSVNLSQLRPVGSQLQTVLHSIISTRIVMHLANITDDSDGKDSLVTGGIQFAPNLSSRSECSRISLQHIDNRDTIVLRSVDFARDGSHA